MVESSIVIDVVDCGSSIPLDHREKVLDPFFTTKKEGTGLGLAIVKTIVEVHKGSSEISDNAPKRTILGSCCPGRNPEQNCCILKF